MNSYGSGDENQKNPVLFYFSLDNDHLRKPKMVDRNILPLVSSPPSLMLIGLLSCENKYLFCFGGIERFRASGDR